MNLLRTDHCGLYCAAGGFHVDPWRPVERAVITHAHSDHARPGSKSYLCAEPGKAVLVERLGQGTHIETLPYGQARTIQRVRLSFHPAGHLLGSAQVRIECEGQVWVVSGDYKTQPDSTCAAFEPVRCQVFITESTFGLPIYRWRESGEIFEQIHQWWNENQRRGRTSLLLGYALGKAQRLLQGLDPHQGPILVHGTVARFLPAYRAAGVRLPEVAPATGTAVRESEGRALVVAPPAAAGSPWAERLGPTSTALASGWMLLRGARRRRSADHGFVLSDHADWDGLLSAIAATQAETILVTHGYTGPLVRWLREAGHHAAELATPSEGQGHAGSDITEAAS